MNRIRIRLLVRAATAATLSLLVVTASGAKIPEQTVPIEKKQPIVVMVWLTAESGPQDLGRVGDLGKQAADALKSQQGCSNSELFTGITVDLEKARILGQLPASAYYVLLVSTWDSEAALEAYEQGDAHSTVEKALKDSGLKIGHTVQQYQRVSGGIEIGDDGLPRYVGSDQFRIPLATNPVMTIAKLQIKTGGGGGMAAAGPPPGVAELNSIIQPFLQGLVKDPGLLHLDAVSAQVGDTTKQYLVGWWQDRRALMGFYSSPTHRAAADWLLAAGQKADPKVASAFRFAIEVYQRVSPDAK